MSTVGLAFDDPTHVVLEPLLDAEPRISLIDAFDIFRLEPL
jgi:hypothetical protein